MGDRLDEARQKARDAALGYAKHDLRDRAAKLSELHTPTWNVHFLMLACLDLADELEARAKAHGEDG